MKHQVTCDGCGDECEVPFKPTSSKPVYCDDCFKKTANRRGDTKGSRAQKDNSKEIEELNLKLDVVLDMLRDLKKDIASSKEKAEPVKEKKTTKKKPAEKKAKTKKAAAKKKTVKKKTTKKKK